MILCVAFLLLWSLFMKLVHFVITIIITNVTLFLDRYIIKLCPSSQFCRSRGASIDKDNSGHIGRHWYFKTNITCYQPFNIQIASCSFCTQIHMYMNTTVQCKQRVHTMTQTNYCVCCV